jgi:NADH-quinone oxidoreductase subunit J
MILKSENPVHSVLFLVFVFYCSSIILFIFEAEFLALSFVIIYVGAIAVLFLFVVMMLDLKKFERSTSFNFYFVLSGIFLLLLETFFILKKYFFTFDSIFVKFYSYIYLNLVDELSNIEIISQSLYNYFLICFLLAGIVLLVAVLGSIILTLDFNNKERYLSIYLNNTSRTSNKIVFFS